MVSSKYLGVDGLKILLQQFESQMTTVEREIAGRKKCGCKKITNTVQSDVNGKKYTGTYFEHPNRNHEIDIYCKETFFATVLASFGLSVYMVEENESESGTKVDAIVNNVPVDFKTIGCGKNAVKNNYQNGMDKDYCLGIIIHSKDAPNYDKNKAKNFDYYIQGITKTHTNGLLCIWNETDDELVSYDMQKIRASNTGGSTGRAPGASAPNSL